MSIIRAIPEAEATGIVAELYAEDIEDSGQVESVTKVLALNPEAERAWEELMRTITSSMDMRRYDLVTLAAARGVKSQHCRLAYGAKSLRIFDEDQLTKIAIDYHHADLTSGEVAMMDYAERVSQDSFNMTDADSQALRDHGFTDREIVDITLAAAARNYLSRTIQALAVDVEIPTSLTPQLASALTDGFTREQH
ncbi:MAG TPA: hypothetical protein VHV31_01675 [Nitrolancea sp.]|jgi:uncharacterized peroxidase-related enzyme|nr:hypothetical protein [Nitrolancea sp.]